MDRSPPGHVGGVGVNLRSRVLEVRHPGGDSLELQPWHGKLLLTDMDRGSTIIVKLKYSRSNLVTNSFVSLE